MSLYPLLNNTPTIEEPTLNPHPASADEYPASLEDLMYHIHQQLAAGGLGGNLKTDLDISATSQQVKDTNNNGSALFISTDQVGVGEASPVITDKFFIKADGSIGATTPLHVVDSNGNELLEIHDNASGRMVVGDSTNGFGFESRNHDAKLFIGASNVPSMNIHVRNLADTAFRNLRYFGGQFVFENSSGALALMQGGGLALNQTNPAAGVTLAAQVISMANLPAVPGAVGTLWVDAGAGNVIKRA